LSINTKGPLTLEPDQSQQVLVMVKAPNSKGMIDLPLTIVSNDPTTSEKVVRVSAKLAGPALKISPGSLNFGLVRIKDPVQATLTLANTGNARLKVSNIQLDSNLFQLHKPFSSIELDAGQKATIQVKFQPLAVGEASTNLIVSSNAGRQEVKLSASGSQLLEKIEVTAEEDKPKSITLSANDAGEDTLAYTVVSPPSNGKLSGIPPNLTYTPNTGFSGADSFTFKVNDGTFDSAEVTVSITVEKPAVVNIPDANLKVVLKAALKINAGQEITKEALVGLVNLIAQNRGITNLSGLEHCTNLTRLYLGNNLLTDLNGLANVNLSKLTDLALNNNQISDISLLANLTDLTNLTVLNLANNQLTDLNGLSNASLPNLTELYLANNQLTDLDGLADATLPKLTGLYLADNQLTDLNGLANINLPNLTWLYLNNNQLHNVSPLANLTNITELNLKGQPLNADAYTNIIPALKARGVDVLFDANTPPVADDLEVTLDQGRTKVINLNLSASNADRDTLTYTVVSQPRSGELSGNTFNLTYMPNAGFFGEDSFTFKVNDGTFYSTEATVAITVEKSTAVNIPDSNLRAALELALRINPGQEITKEILAGLVNLIAQSREITNLNGLEYCTNLTKLYLANNQLIDLNGLANANLPNLTELYLNNNQLTDLNGLAKANLPNLTVLNLANNQLTDLHDLTNAKLTNLTSLHLYDNQLTDLNGLTNANVPNLTMLYLSNNRISNISVISNLTNLTMLWLYNNQISDISPLIANTGIKGTIKLKGNPLNNKALFTHVPVIEARGIGIEYDMPKDAVMFKDSNLEKAIRDALGIPTKLLKKEDLAKLEKLEAENKEISDLTAIEHCTNLTVLYLNNNQISDIRPLANADLVKLTELYLNENQLIDLNGLAKADLPKLTGLYLNDNQISDISPLANLPNLTELYLASNQLANLNGLAQANLPKLTGLYLNETSWRT